jgi:excisionase family DNA binding protein
MDPIVTLRPMAVRLDTAARLLDCGTTKIRELVKTGELRTIRVGADQRVVFESLEAFLARQRQG